MQSQMLGLIDSGIAGPAQDRVVAARSFFLDAAGQIRAGACQGDAVGHGSAMAEILIRRGNSPALYDARVFQAQMRCSAAQVAAALLWLRSSGVRLVNMSVGLRQDRAVLRQACEEALAADMLLVASAPARGERVFPAAYPGILSATGDARCAPGEISHLNSPQAEFGAHVRSFDNAVAGASAGCAHITAHCARFLTEHPRATREQVRDWLVASASYRGIERRLI